MTVRGPRQQPGYTPPRIGEPQTPDFHQKPPAVDDIDETIVEIDEEGNVAEVTAGPEAVGQPEVELDDDGTATEGQLASKDFDDALEDSEVDAKPDDD